MLLFVRSCGFVIAAIWIMATTVHADISKERFASEVVTEMQRIMLSQSGTLQRGDQNHKELIRSRCNAVAEAIRSIPVISIDDATAQWIKQSILYFVNEPQWGFGDKSGVGKNQFEGFLKQAKERFKVLTSEKSKVLLAKREKAVGDGEVYRSAYARWLASKFSTAKIIEVTFSSPVDTNTTKSSTIKAPNLDAFISAMGYRIGLNEMANGQKRLNFESEQIDSQLLTLALIYSIEKGFEFFATVDVFSLGNLFSRLYAEDPSLPSHPKSFDEVLPDLERMVQKCLRSEKDILHLDYESFQSLMWAGHNIRKSNSLPPLDETPKKFQFNVSFANARESWNLIDGKIEPAKEIKP